MTYSSPTEWIRGVRSVRRGEFVGHSGLDEVSWDQTGDGLSPPIDTPVDTWSDDACYRCSFCGHPCTDFRVDFIQVLSSPFVVTCGPCTKIR